MSVLATCSGEPTALDQSAVLEIVADTSVALRDTLPVSVRLVLDGQEISDVAFQLSSSDSATLGVDGSGGRLIGRRLGDATLTARMVGSMVPSPAPSATLRVFVVPEAAIIEPDSVAFNSIGERMSLTLIALDAAGQAIGGVIPVWHSSDTSRVRVDALGTATARAPTTTPVTVTASVSARSVSIPVTVRNVPVTLTLLPSDVTLVAVGQTRLLTATALNALGGAVGGSALQWETSNPSVLALSGSGDARTATALAPGSADVIVTGGGLEAVSHVTVTNDPVIVRIEPDNIGLPYPGALDTPAVTLVNALGDTLSRDAATWSADDPLIVRVSRDGVITAREIGETMVRLSSPHASDSVLVVVTNEPATLTVDAEMDTLPGLGQTLRYGAVVRNGSGSVIAVPVAWRSSNESIVRVSVEADGSAIATAVGFGAGAVIAEAGEAADTVMLVVRNPTRIHVDNGAFITQRNGTRARPFARIQDAVTVADAFDTILVSLGAFPYAETVNLSRRLTLLGDAPGFDPNAPDPLLLPVISHDTGAAAIVAQTTAPQVIRRFRVRHTVDGPAVHAAGPDIEIEHLYVNLLQTGRIGQGILIENGATRASARIDRSTIQAVAGYGVRIESVTGGRVARVSVDGVDASAAGAGDGIHLIDAVGVTVDSVRVRRAAGTHVQARGGASVTISGADLMARNRLIVLDSVAGSSSIVGGTFLMDRPSDDPVMTGSAADGRAAVELRASGPVLLTGASFRESSALLDAISVTGPALGPPSDVTLNGVTFARGRYHLRSAMARITGDGVRSDSAQTAFRAEGADTIVLRGSQIRYAATCIQGSTAGSRVHLRATILGRCGTGVGVTGGATLRMDSSAAVKNGIGATIGAGSSLTAWHSDWFDNDTAAVRIDAAGSAALDSNFWGDSRGPRRPANPAATGDTIIGLPMPGVVDTTPLNRGSGAQALRAIRGQSAPSNSFALATVRVIDAGGRPVAGVGVTFNCSSCGGTGPRLQTASGFVSSGNNQQHVVTSRTDGLAEVAVDLRGFVGSLNLAVTATGVAGVSVVVVGQ